MNRLDNWTRLVELCIGKLPKHGDIPCVYAMRLRDNGELLYIGSTGNLRRRVFGNYFGGVGGETTKRLHSLLFLEKKVEEVELAYEETDTYREREAELKKAYHQLQGRLPKWNKL